MSKIIGYLLAIVGIVGLAASQVPQVAEALTFLPLDQIDETTLLIVSVALAAVGIALIIKGGGGGRRGKMTEVPIFHGKNVVGYRRTR